MLGKLKRMGGGGRKRSSAYVDPRDIEGCEALLEAHFTQVRHCKLACGDCWLNTLSYQSQIDAEVMACTEICPSAPCGICYYSATMDSSHGMQAMSAMPAIAEHILLWALACSG